ncbi:GNAT family N-acetyltransferase [Angustibacter luteus]|uniref:GNAT family N-acetyltransferase n=1 Tax=Angustibacter luteus TaxID=658456 RepID=A0ABW1JJ66_9ACTN
MTRYDVRPAEPADAEVLGAIHILIWQQAYAGLMPAEYLAGLSVPGSIERWHASLATTRPGRATYVGTADGAVVGFCTAGPTRDDPADPAHELWVLNVLAEHHGSGLATRLLEATFGAVGIDGTTPVSLWVLRGNERAAAFYRRLGFAPTEVTKAHPATGVLEERWVRS